MENKFINELDIFLLDNENCTQEEREEIIEFVYFKYYKGKN